MIDPGHGGIDSGAIGNGLIEKELNLKIAFKIHRYLVNNFNCDAKLTRLSDEDVSLEQRALEANYWGADFFYSVHCNAHTNRAARGWETFTFENAPTETRILQSVIHPKIFTFLKDFNVVDRGKKQANFYVLRETSMPAVLAEYLFVTNDSDSFLLKREDFIDDLAKASAYAIAEAFRLEVLDSDKIFDDVPTDHWARRYIEWAFSIGIVSGVGNNKFAHSEEDLERKAQILVMIGRYHKFLFSKLKNK